jgi:hypothetical protein
MSDQTISLRLEIPPEVAQQDIWDLEKQCKQVAGVMTDLQEPRDSIAATLLFIFIVGQAVTIAGGINTIHDLAQNIYDFLHPKRQEIDQQKAKNKVVIIKEGKRTELYNLTQKEIEKVLEEQ